jgi:hypothetical protein
MKRLAPYAAGLVFALGFVFACTNDVNDNEQFREDVIACENAVARIESCCPDVAPPADACRYHYDKHYMDCGCSSSAQSYTEEKAWPVLAVDESDAIARAPSCASVMCADARAKLAREHTSTGGAPCPNDSSID